MVKPWEHLRSVPMFSVVDYDPSGYWIARELAAQLRAFGVEDVTLHTLMRPERLPAEQVRLARYTLPKGSKTTNWLRETGEQLVWGPKQA